MAVQALTTLHECRLRRTAGKKSSHWPSLGWRRWWGGGGGGGRRKRKKDDRRKKNTDSCVFFLVKKKKKKHLEWCFSRKSHSPPPPPPPPQRKRKEGRQEKKNTEGRVFFLVKKIALGVLLFWEIPLPLPGVESTLAEALWLQYNLTSAVHQPLSCGRPASSLEAASQSDPGRVS